MFELTVVSVFWGTVVALLLFVWLVLRIARHVHERRTQADKVARGTLLGERSYHPQTAALLKKPDVHPLLMPKETVRRSARAEARHAEQQFKAKKPTTKLDYDDDDDAMQLALRAGQVDVYKSILESQRPLPAVPMTSFVPGGGSYGGAGASSDWGEPATSDSCRSVDTSRDTPSTYSGCDSVSGGNAGNE